MRLLYLSPVPWRSFAQRPHRFVDWFHRSTGARVLWVDPYPTRLPRWSDLRRLSAVEPPAASDDPPWLERLRPRSLPIEPLTGVAAANKLLWRDAFRACTAFADTPTAVIGIGKPSAFAVDLLRSLPGKRSFYDAMDDFSAFYRGVSRRALARREHEIVDRVTDLFASSTVLTQRWAGRHARIRHVP
ncbi:MAG: glycosyl transferase, partial [Burkholderiaceae bacterium]